MIRFIFICSFISLFLACRNQSEPDKNENQLIHNVLDSLNARAARADYHAYFALYAKNAVFTGTDATERWTKDEFMIWAKPFFDKGKAWNFTSVDRHIFLSENGQIAWFDELLSTQMKICRGSGVLSKEGETWKLQQYILSTTIPNPILDSVVILKTQEDSLLKNKYAIPSR